MNNIISKISEIEASAASIMEAAAQRKKDYARETEEKKAAFDRELEAQTDAELGRLRAAMEEEAQKQLDAQRREADDTIRRMEEKLSKTPCPVRGKLVSINDKGGDYMGNLLTYSRSHHQSPGHGKPLLHRAARYEELASLATVGEALEFIKSQPAYGEVLASADSSTHRSELEKLLLLSRYRDFEKLYRFAGPGPRKFLSLYFSGFEIALLKRCLRSIAGPEKRPVKLELFQDFFSRHSRLDVAKLSACATVADLTAALKGTPLL